MITAVNVVGMRMPWTPIGDGTALEAEALVWFCRRAREVFAKMDCHALARVLEADLHLLIEYPPKLSVSILVNAKGSWSRLLCKERPDIARSYCGRRAISPPQRKARRLLLFGSMSSSSAPTLAVNGKVSGAENRCSRALMSFSSGCLSALSIVDCPHWTIGYR